MAGGTFSATVDAWVAKSKKRMEVVFKQSVQDVVGIMQKPVGGGGNMPVDTGFLRASLEAKIGAAPTGYKVKTRFIHGAYRLNDAQYTLTINRAALGDTIFAVYLASYAWYVENGSQGRSARGFVRLAALQWRSVVASNVKKARNIT